TAPVSVAITSDADPVREVSTENLPSSNVAEVEVSPPVYELREDPKDPGWILFQGLLEEMRTQLAEAGRLTQQEAMHEIFRQRGGPPRRARPGQMLLHWEGVPGEKVPGQAMVLSEDGTRKARLHGRRDIRLGSLLAVIGVSCPGL